ncbi:hypothetical protein CMALT430_70075 [Carnobacterium maltaromaticum]|nr:hypothetical protein CMALT430_70075 [Carnobacterium maltaromaticum]
MEKYSTEFKITLKIYFSKTGFSIRRTAPFLKQNLSTISRELKHHPHKSLLFPFCFSRKLCKKQKNMRASKNIE